MESVEDEMKDRQVYIFYTSVDEIGPNWFTMKNVQGKAIVKHSLKEGDSVKITVEKLDEKDAE